ncbi:F-box protein At2g39490-like [Durio zibethinus]|uniref:F-box protein At2g39490-like n=1 Tax=Durio zibethinus TaxID=66656 RepID=A0A6P6AIC1_DURZI|nr:F-box protein At2g39490-like [Durio zibethinus]
MSQSDQSGSFTRFTNQLNLIQPFQKVKAKIKHKIDQDDNKKLEHGKVDMISSLPNDILCRIISFLPFESAVQTSLLSTRWKNLWKMALVKDGNKDEAVFVVLNFVNDFPQLHLPANNWGLQYNFGQGSVLSVAIVPKGTLHLDFSAGKQEITRQFSLSLDRKRHINYHQPSLSTAFKLKSLYLVSVSHVSTEMVSCLFSNMPFLESLTIARCNGLQYIQLDGNSQLQQLAVLDCLQLLSIQLDFNFYFSLKSFHYRGRAVSLKYYNKDPLYYFYSPANDDSPFDLEDAMLDFRQGPGYYGINRPGFNLILQSIREIKTLTLCRWVFKELICPELYLLGEGFYRLTELWWIDNSLEKYDSTALISFLKLCPQLTRLYITIDPNSYYTTNINMSLIKVTSPIKLKHLKAVKLEGFENEEEEIILAKQLKEVFQAEPLFIKWDGTVRQLVKVDEQLKEGTDAYEFIEKKVENLHELCPKHVHMDI